MPSPVYSAGSAGSMINGIAVAHGTTVAAFLDLSICIEGQVSCEMTAGAMVRAIATNILRPAVSP